MWVRDIGITIVKVIRVPKYYCLLCENSHPEIKPSITCPSCGRIFCIESITQSFSVGKTGCPYCDHSLEEIGKSNEFALHSENKRGKSSSSFSIFDRFSKTSNKQENQNIVIYVLISCITLPFIAIIALMFLKVFSMFFEILFS